MPGSDVSMIDRVASALYDADPTISGGPSFDHPAIRREYTRLARAAITAMREPTRGMWTAYNREFGRDPWRSMIDVALTEKPEPPTT